MMKLHFGHGVLVFGIVFAAFVISLVVKMVSQRVDLVETNYYEQGLEYQTVIANKKNERLGFNLTQIEEVLVVEPLGNEGANSCVMVFYRPSDSRLDTTFLVPLQEGRGEVNLSGLEKGLWRYTLSYQENTAWHYQQEDLIWQ